MYSTDYGTIHCLEGHTKNLDIVEAMALNSEVYFFKALSDA